MSNGNIQSRNEHEGDLKVDDLLRQVDGGRGHYFSIPSGILSKCSHAELNRM